MEWPFLDSFCAYQGKEADVPLPDLVMMNHNWKRNATTLAALFCLGMNCAAADDTTVSITVDWPSRSRPCPPKVDKETNVNMVVLRVNDMVTNLDDNGPAPHYEYRLNAYRTARAVDDAGSLGGLTAQEKASAEIQSVTAPGCATTVEEGRALWKHLREALKAKTSLIISKDNQASVSLDASLQQWNEFRRDEAASIARFKNKIAALQPGKCTGEVDPDGLENLLKGYNRFADIETRAAGKHQVQLVFAMGPNEDIDFELIETWNGQPTKGGTHRWRCGEDDVLTLSLGSMFTSVPYRTYSHGKALTAAGGSQDQLVVGGNSRLTPQGVALLNYKLPLPTVWPRWLGLSVSSGPAFKFGGKAEVSTFGYFGGISFNLWRRLFLTPGVHVGEFADFPAGFYPGAKIPDQFGDLNPVKRWTGHFAFAVTYQTKSFGKSSGSGTPKGSDTAKSKKP